MSKTYSCIGLGGTFDHLHKGHREFILFAHTLADRLIIGVTDQTMTVNKLFAQTIQPLVQRIQAVKSFCQQHEIIADVVILHDVFGPTITSNKVSALAVTEETVEGGHTINSKRELLGLSKLPVHVFSLVPDELGLPITSTRIRAGEIDGEGTVFRALLRNGITLNGAQRRFFSLPQGEIVSKAPKIATQPIFVVGDICLQNFHELGCKFHAGWFDNRSARTAITPTIWKKTNVVVQNSPGGFSKTATESASKVVNTIAKLWSQNLLPASTTLVEVQGEEDLAAVVLTLLAPLGSKIYYGQPGQGMVQIEVTETVKHQFVTHLL